MGGDLTRKRKNEHLEICATRPVGSATGALLDQVGLIHDAVPELAWDALDLSVEMFGKRLSAPILIASMTGGTPEAGAFNEVLARVAERHRIGLALGSQRVMLEDSSAVEGFLLRDVAPTTLLLGNLGAVQAGKVDTGAIERRLVRPCGLDGLCLHLNVAQELFQPEGDRDFRGVGRTIRRLSRELSVPVLVKETGCGLSRFVGARLKEWGVEWVDVSGAGGTSFVSVELARGRVSGSVGDLFRDWGVPTAASLCQLSGLGAHLVASGGVETGLDAARALVLGAEVVGVARPLLRAYHRGGEEAVEAEVLALVEGLKVTMMLTGSRTLSDLRALPWVCGPRLSAWLEPGTPVQKRARTAGLHVDLGVAQ